MEYPGVDADTVRYFKDVYLPSSIDIFEAMGQTPEDIAKVSLTGFLLSFKNQHCVVLCAKWCRHSTDVHSNETSQNFLFASHPSSALKRLLSQAALASGI